MPQGSNLGPLLFLIYINDLPNCLENVSTSMFADNTSLSSKSRNEEELEESLNSTLENVHQWLCSNKLTLSRDKTEYMIIASRQRLHNINSDPLIKLGNNNIKRVRQYKTLGVIVDDKLLWNEHIDSITTRASKGLGMLRRMKPFVPRSILVMVYKSLILPYLDYCCLVWDNCSNYLLDNLQKIQNRAARIITGES